MEPPRFGLLIKEQFCTICVQYSTKKETGLTSLFFLAHAVDDLLEQVLNFTKASRII